MAMITPTVLDRRHSIVASPYGSNATYSPYRDAGEGWNGYTSVNFSPSSRYSSISKSFHSSNSSSSPDGPATEITTITTDSEDERDDVAAHYTTRKPKIEELDDDDVPMHTVAEVKEDDAKPSVVHGEVTLPPPRKKRGRPRKHPIEPPEPSKKASHARSKTGCGTCRRRKKKCDETKPACMNCEKNNVVCDGYEPKQPWRSGKEKQSLRVQRSLIHPNHPALPSLTPAGVEDRLDALLLRHFIQRVSNLLSLTDLDTPFLLFIVPMAREHEGLMHSVLSLSGSSRVADMPSNCVAEWEKRSVHHHDRALQFLREAVREASLDKLAITSDDSSTEENPGEAQKASTAQIPSTAIVPTNGQYASYGSTTRDVLLVHSLMMCLQTVAIGNTFGDYAVHLNFMKDMLMSPDIRSGDEKLHKFIAEFVLYHDCSSSVTDLKSPWNERSDQLLEQVQPPKEQFNLPKHIIQPGAGSLLGVMDGLFALISRIRKLRTNIRERRKAASSSKHRFQDQYFDEEIYDIDAALRQWRSPYTPDTPRFTASLLYRQSTYVYLHRTIRPSKPHDSLKEAVDVGLELLRDLPINDKDDGSTQSILLMPLFILGCAAFEREQRPEISEAFHKLKKWSNLGNIIIAREVVGHIWNLMDQNMEEKTWDWETLMEEKEMNFLIT